MKLFVMFILAASLPLFAVDQGQELLSARTIKNAEFYWSSVRSYYACNYAEGQTQRYLDLLGAQDVQTKCRGGIEFGKYWGPLRLDASFSLLDANDNGTEMVAVQRVVIRGSESCEFNVKLMDTLLKQIPHVLVEKRASCFNSQGSFKYVVEVLR